jgi:hypothetical protein
MVRAPFSLIVLAALVFGGCSLVVDFDRSLLQDDGTDAGIDAGVDASIDAEVEEGSESVNDGGTDRTVTSGD